MSAVFENDFISSVIYVSFKCNDLKVQKQFLKLIKILSVCKPLKWNIKWGMTSNHPITYFMAMFETIPPLLYRPAPLKLRPSLSKKLSLEETKW